VSLFVLGALLSSSVVELTSRDVDFIEFELAKHTGYVRVLIQQLCCDWPRSLPLSFGEPCAVAGCFWGMLYELQVTISGSGASYQQHASCFKGAMRRHCQYAAVSRSCLLRSLEAPISNKAVKKCHKNMFPSWGIFRIVGSSMDQIVDQT
jgi:hypothetical protein